VWRVPASLCNARADLSPECRRIRWDAPLVTGRVAVQARGDDVGRGIAPTVATPEEVLRSAPKGFRLCKDKSVGSL
jgi:hypothetical protein